MCVCMCERERHKTRIEEITYWAGSVDDKIGITTNGKETPR